MDTRIAFAGIIMVFGMFCVVKHIEEKTVANDKLTPAMFQLSCGDEPPSRKQPLAPTSPQEAVRRLDCIAKSAR